MDSESRDSSIDIESGSYEENLLITLTSKTEGADIYYTTDGRRSQKFSHS